MYKKLEKIPEDIKRQIYFDIEKLYKDLTQELQQLSQPCTSCGLCCHFNKMEHYLYTTTLEIMYLVEKYQVSPLAPDDEKCPFLRNDKCTVRDRRMLGCRTYFRLHSKEEKIKAQEIYEKYLTLLRKLHQKYNMEYHYQDCMEYFKEIFGVTRKGGGEK